MASMVYNYKHGFSGFAAMLTEDHAKQLAGQNFQDHATFSNRAMHVVYQITLKETSTMARVLFVR
jgi:tetraacyldisaccharide-1-P 4'-kinase